MNYSKLLLLVEILHSEIKLGQMANPFKNILTVKRDEIPLASVMFGYFFSVITIFWILKPIKKTIFYEFYSGSGFQFLNWDFTVAQAELIAKLLNMVVAFFAVMVFTLISRKYKRQQLTYIFTTFFIFCFTGYACLLNNPNTATVWSFYLFGDLFSTVMVASFFAFLNDSVTPDTAKRLYGIIGLGGVIGGVFGTSFVRLQIDNFSSSSWLWICFAIGLLIVTLAATAGKIIGSQTQTTLPEQNSQNREKSDKNFAIEGAHLVFKSKYLISILLIVGFYEIVSTTLDFQFSSTICYYLDPALNPGVDEGAIGRQFATMFAVTNWVSMFVQLFLTSFIMTRFGLTTALLVLPLAVLAGSSAFIVMPVLWIGSFLNTADNGFSYSINQSAKETLYVPLSRKEKYKAKAFIDMFGQRFAKAIAVLFSLLITSVFTNFSAIRWLSLFVLIIIVLWVFTARYAGRQFHLLTDNSTPNSK